MAAREPHPLIAQLAAMRRERGISQEAVAKRMDCPGSTVGRWEVGLGDPKLTSFVRHAHALDREVTLTPLAPARAPVSAPINAHQAVCGHCGESNLLRIDVAVIPVRTRGSDHA